MLSYGSKTLDMTSEVFGEMFEDDFADMCPNFFAHVILTSFAEQGVLCAQTRERGTSSVGAETSFFSALAPGSAHTGPSNDTSGNFLAISGDSFCFFPKKNLLTASASGVIGRMTQVVADILFFITSSVTFEVISHWQDLR